MAKLTLMFVAILMFTFVHNGQCTKCYKCSTHIGTWQCGEPFVAKDIGTIDCPNEVGCLKIKHPTVGGGREPISRGCYDENLCDEYSVCKKCNSDLCNSTASVVPSFIVTLIISLWYVRNYLVQ